MKFWGRLWGRSQSAAELFQDEARLRRLQWRVFFAITLGYGIFYVCRLSLNVAKKPLIDQGVFDAAQLGQIGSSLFFMYAAGRLVNGALADHAHVGRFMAMGLFMSALANVALGGMPVFSVFLLLWGANGWAQSMGVPASVVTMSRWFAQRGGARSTGSGASATTSVRRLLFWSLQRWWPTQGQLLGSKWRV